jgi:short-subunit dehydrogenase
MSRELVPRLVERGAGHLVFISSLSGKAATARASVYCATKFGLRGFALALREDLRGSGVGVSVVMPGTIRDAGMFADSGVTAPALMGTGKPEQVGAAVVRAIERNRGELSVAPIRQRALSAMAANAPEISGRVAGGTATKVADEVARGQSEKR